MKNEKAWIVKQEIVDTFKMGPLVLLTLKIFYPKAELPEDRRVQALLNGHYKGEAQAFYRYAAGSLNAEARSEYAGSIKNGFPFRPFDALMTYSVELNEGCHLSTYYEQYTYTGGAHGGTVRHSDNWDLSAGKRLRLKDLFPPGTNYRQLLLERMFAIADRRMASDPHVYFEDYRSLMEKYFDPESFYLTPRGLALYYQLYEIAPYLSGIVTFEIPYAELGIRKPACIKSY